MNKMTKLNLSFTSLAFALPLVMCGCDHKAPQTDSMMPDSMTATNAPEMMQTNSNSMNSMAPQTGSMAPNNMSGGNNMGGSSPSMNSMAPNTMNATNQMQMSNTGSTNSMAPNSMTSTNQI
jgi:hypothetical protein